jgi:nucleotide-binding universal stress UspA family protein
MRVEKVLVPLDGSPVAEAALPVATDLVKQNPGATVTLLRAAEAPTLPGADPVAPQVMAVREAEDYLETVARRLVRDGVKVKTSVWYGPPASSIVEAAEAGKVDLIVMNSHGRTGLGRLVLGSVAESVLRGTRTPILLLRAPGAPIEAPRGTAEMRSTREPSHV